MDNPYPWLQDFINEIPDPLQPVMVALVAAIPYVEGEGASALGIIAGINPIVAALAAMVGNILCVVGVVLLGSRSRGGVVARRAVRAQARAGSAVAAGSRPGAASAASEDIGDELDVAPEPQSKGRAKLRRWLVRFGVPGAS